MAKHRKHRMSITEFLNRESDRKLRKKLAREKRKLWPAGAGHHRRVGVTKPTTSRQCFSSLISASRRLGRKGDDDGFEFGKYGHVQA